MKNFLEITNIKTSTIEIASNQPAPTHRMPIPSLQWHLLSWRMADGCHMLMAEWIKNKRSQQSVSWEWATESLHGQWLNWTYAPIKRLCKSLPLLWASIKKPSLAWHFTVCLHTWNRMKEIRKICKQIKQWRFQTSTSLQKHVHGESLLSMDSS